MKLSVLRACRRLLKPGGRMAFYVIRNALRLRSERRRRADEAGPPYTTTPGSYERLLDRAGLVDVVVDDVTDAYLATARAWLDHSAEMAAELDTMDLPTSLEERQANRRATIAAIEDGLLKRSLYVARRPG